MIKRTNLWLNSLAINQLLISLGDERCVIYTSGVVWTSKGFSSALLIKSRTLLNSSCIEIVDLTELFAILFPDDKKKNF